MNKILLNHVGFNRHSFKRFLVIKPDSMTFEIESLVHCVHTCVYKGELHQLTETIYEGDFSAVNDPCDYRIKVGSEYSRYFVITDNAYDMAERLMLQYFTLQRCGSPLGWAGLCHQDDGYITETGDKADFRGGYHQSSDLRKSPGGVSIGVIGMLRWALQKHPMWDNGCISDEIRWACDYYLKVVSPSGCVYNTLNAPLGWSGRLFYAAGAPECCQWNNCIILALGAKYFEDKDKSYSDRLLSYAKRIWAYLTRPNREKKIYRHPDVLPRGMDADNFYSASFKDSSSDLCSRLAAAVSIYKLEGGKEWEDEIISSANKLATRLVDGEDNPVAGAIRTDDDSLKLMQCGGSYGWTGSGFGALLDAWCTLPFCEYASNWLEALKKNADLRMRFCSMNPWHYPASIGSEENMAQPTGHPAPGKPVETIGSSFANSPVLGYVSNASGKKVSCKWRETHSCALGAENASYLARLGRILRNDAYLTFAQHQWDCVVGANEFDQSSIECVGFNQPCGPVFGQFFPSTPKLPGAVLHTGAYEKNRFSETNGEYDMPAVGMLMWAAAELDNDVLYAEKLMHEQYDATWKH